MTIIVNGENIEISEGCKTIAALLEYMEIPVLGVAVAVDKSVITRARWNCDILADGVKVTIIRATQGG